MSLSARRLIPLLFVACLLAPPPPAEPAPSPSPTGPSSGASLSRGVRSTAGTGPQRRTRRRSARRAPPGGVWARNAVVIDPATDQVLYEKNAAITVPIASLSKLMTALVLLEQDPDLERAVEVSRADVRGAGRSTLRAREHVSLGDLLRMSLMSSDNAATRVLVRESGLAPEDFLARMNRKAVELGLARTRFVEFTGLDQRNVATAADCARLLRAAATHPTVQEIMTTRTYHFRSHYRQRRIAHAVHNTNRLLYGRYEIRGGKTGFISEAGYCVATWVHAGGRDLIAVVLGAPTNATRFADVVRLVQRTTPSSVLQAN
jgi:D-alanyl-D-alanine carboxypeptidase